MHLSFEPLSLDRQGDYRLMFRSSPQRASDYSFVNLWAWQRVYGLQWAWSPSQPLVWIRQNRPCPVYWAPVGPWPDIDWPAALAEIEDLSQVPIIRVPELLCRQWSRTLGQGVSITQSQGHWDYLYRVQELVELRGRRLHKKKNLLNQFLKGYESRYVPLGPSWGEETLALQTEWCLWRNCEGSSTLEAENQAIVQVLSDWEHLFGVRGGGLLVEGKMIAFTVAEALDQSTLCIHFEKACPAFKGAYQAINQIFLAQQGQGFEWVNREQDLGDPGLRKAKASYYPSAYLKKSRVQLG